MKFWEGGGEKNMKSDRNKIHQLSFPTLLIPSMKIEYFKIEIIQ